MLETDAAWNVFEKMEDFYFEKVQVKYGLKSLLSPRAKTAIKGGLLLEQQDQINDLIKERLEYVPADRRKAMAIRIYSAINTKFETKGMKHGYKNIQPEHFENIMQLITRLPLDENYLLTFTQQDFEAKVSEITKSIEGKLLPKEDPKQSGLSITIESNEAYRVLVNTGPCGTRINKLLPDEIVATKASIVNELRSKNYVVAEKTPAEIRKMVKDFLPIDFMPVIIHAASDRMRVCNWPSLDKA